MVLGFFLLTVRTLATPVFGSPQAAFAQKKPGEIKPVVPTPTPIASPDPSHALDAVFSVKKGTIEGGCDDYRKPGQEGGNLDDYFENAKDVLKIATEGFSSYNTNHQVQRVAKAFFGINPNKKLDFPATGEDEKVLGTVKGQFESFPFNIDAD